MSRPLLGSLSLGLAFGLVACAGNLTDGASPSGKGRSTESSSPYPGNPQGIDVSHWQGAIDWGAVAGAGYSFAIASVGDGSYRDPQFAANWSGMKQAGLIRGAYQFFEPGEDAVMQANILLDMMGSLGSGDLPPTLDVEAAGGQGPAAICADVHRWVDTVAQATGRTPIIYTGGWFWNPQVRCGDFGGTNPLWISDYGDPRPRMATGWSTWAIWQYDDKGRVPGIGGDVDMDVFAGSMDDLRALADGAAPPPGPMSGGQSCAGLNDGDYCGGDYLTGDAGTLYTCAGGVVVSSTPCASGCSVQPDGTNDVCNAVTNTSPCAGLSDGDYCGGDYIQGDSSTLYTCAGGALVGSVPCASGCSVQPNGTNDVCNTATNTSPCAGLNDGDYCGGDSISGDSNTLYTCAGGALVGSVPCDAGCSVQPNGTNDLCNPPQASGPSCAGLNDGDYCGSDYVNGDPDTLYTCSGGNVVASAPCSAGCNVQPDGTNDACNATGSGASCAGLNDGDYCGSDYVQGDPDTLYTCSGGAVVASTPCSAGCNVQSAGTNDFCN